MSLVTILFAVGVCLCEKTAYFELSDHRDQVISPYLLGVNGGPWPAKRGFDNFTPMFQSYLGTKYFRLHDVMNQDLKHGCDVHIIYPDSRKDPTSASSYNFTLCDSIMTRLKTNGFSPYLRIGVSYGSSGAWRDMPPASHSNFAKAMVVLIERYRYEFTSVPMIVELWNEPFNDNGEFWHQDELSTFSSLVATLIRTIRDEITSISPFYGARKRQPSSSVISNVNLSNALAPLNLARLFLPRLELGCCGFAPSGCLSPSGQANVIDLFESLESSSLKDELDFLSFHMYSQDPLKLGDCIDFYRDNVWPSKAMHLSEWNMNDGYFSELHAETAAVFIKMVERAEDVTVATFFSHQAQHAGESYGLFRDYDDENPSARAFYLASSFLFDEDGEVRSNRLKAEAADYNECDELHVAFAKSSVASTVSGRITASSSSSSAIVALLSNTGTEDCYVMIGVPTTSITKVDAVRVYTVSSSTTSWPTSYKTTSVGLRSSYVDVIGVTVRADEVRLVEFDFKSSGLLVFEIDFLPSSYSSSSSSSSTVRFALQNAVLSALQLSKAQLGDVEVLELTIDEGGEGRATIRTPVGATFSSGVGVESFSTRLLGSLVRAWNESSLAKGLNVNSLSLKSSLTTTTTKTTSATTTATSQSARTLSTKTTTSTSSSSSSSSTSDSLTRSLSGGIGAASSDDGDGGSAVLDEPTAATLEWQTVVIASLAVAWLLTFLCLCALFVKTRRHPLSSSSAASVDSMRRSTTTHSVRSIRASNRTSRRVPIHY